MGVKLGLLKLKEEQTEGVWEQGSEEIIWV
jgi:hypothetical protein